MIISYALQTLLSQQDENHLTQILSPRSLLRRDEVGTPMDKKEKEEAAKKRKEKEAAKAKKNGNMCPICREPALGKNINTPCGHFFHEQCLKKWYATPGQSIRDNKTCSACGKDFNPGLCNPIYL